MIELTHPFLRRCLDRNALLDDCELLNTYCSRLEKQAVKYSSPDGFLRGTDEKQQNEYKGWGFELFAEFFIKFLGNERRIGILDYKIVGKNDTGVDGTGIGIDGKVATVQVKYRQANYELKANEDHLSNFKAASLSTKYGVSPQPTNGKCNMLIITSGKGLHYFTANEMMPEARVLDREHLRAMVDNHTMFWQRFRESWENSAGK